MAAYTPFDPDEDIGVKDIVTVCSDALDNEAALHEINDWAKLHGYERSGEYILNARRNLSGHRYFYSVCYRSVPSESNTQTVGSVSHRPPEVVIREETVNLGNRLYEQNIHPRVDEQDTGRYVTIDVRSGVYAIGEDHLTTAEKVLSQRPEAILYTRRIGFPAVTSLTGRFRPVTK